MIFLGHPDGRQKLLDSTRDSIHAISDIGPFPLANPKSKKFSKTQKKWSKWLHDTRIAGGALIN